jgi:medium-chain acyl-[acyl-carrier-protein] hydrolase
MSISNSVSAPAQASWFGFPCPNPSARMRLFCFPYAGSGANIFYAWHRRLPADVEVGLVHMPGRERRLNETPFTRMAPLVRSIARALLPYADKPFAFFGHSMGALVIFELSRQLRREYGLTPEQLFVSGHVAPQHAHLVPRVLALPDDLLVKELNSFTGSGALASAQVMELALPALRADLEVCETYTYESDLPLSCPISAYGGMQDQAARREYLEGWRHETSAAFKLRMFSGDHFFIQTAGTEFLRSLSGELTGLAAGID